MAQKDFNSHAHVERDLLQRPTTRLSSFQLTRSRGAWLITIDRYALAHNFNSHAHVERDALVMNKIVAAVISTHTLTWSVTCDVKRLKWYVQISTHTLTWSVTKSMLKKTAEQAFQLTRSRGAWHTQIIELFGKDNFNSHAHVERDTWCCVYLVLAQRDADLFFYLMGIGLILFTVRSQIAWYFHANLLGICGSLGVRWSKY